MSMYQDSGSSIFLLVIAFVFAVLYVWATVVVIVAGHRYLERTKPRGERPGGDQTPPPAR